MKRPVVTIALVCVVVLACLALSADAQSKAPATSGGAAPAAAQAPATPAPKKRTNGPSSAYRPGQKGQLKDVNDRHHAKNGKFQSETATNSAGLKFDRRTGQIKKRVVENPALFKPIKVTGDKNTFAAIHPAPLTVPDVSSKNWNAPRRNYRLTELTRSASNEKNTKVVSKTGSKKQKAPKPGSRLKSAPTGSIPRPTGVRPKFNPKSKQNKNILAFGRGPPVNYNDDAPAESTPAKDAKTEKRTNGESSAYRRGQKGQLKDANDRHHAKNGKFQSETATNSAGLKFDRRTGQIKASPKKAKKSKSPKQAAAPKAAKPKTGAFIEFTDAVLLDTSADETPAPKLVKPVIDEKVVPLAEPAELPKPDLSKLQPCPPNSTTDASLLEVAAGQLETPALKLVKPIIDEKVVPLPEPAAAPKRTFSHLAPCLANSTVDASLLEVDVEHGAHHETVVVVEDQTHQLVEADVGGDVKLPSGLVVTAAQIAEMTALFAKQPEPRVFYHWGDYQASIRWGRNRKVDRGEIEWLNTQNEGMAAGGGYYLAQDPKASYGYGPVPCYVFTPAGSLVMDNNQTPIKAVLKKTLANPDKAVLGQYIPFIHSYNTASGWWVTHHPDILSNIRCGNAIITPDPLGPKPVLNPTVEIDNAAEIRAKGVPAGSRHVGVHFDQLNGQVVTARNVKTQYDAHLYLETMINDKWDDEQIGNDVRNAAKWVRSFFILMQYIDGLSLVRAKKVFPSDPWQAFEPAKFGNFADTFNAYINRRMKGESIGIATKSGVFGDGTSAAAWAAKMVDNVLPRIYSELSGGSEMKFRTGTVRAGGPVNQDPNNRWTTGSFVATAGQVAVMTKNPYLSVESAPYPEGGDPALVLSNYWYPDPLRAAGVSKSISPALAASIAAAGKYDSATGQADLARDTPLLMRDLLVDMFKSFYGKQACSPLNQIDFSGALKAALALVSIHPCSDFNGRSTRFFMLIAALEGCGIIPVSFMSDFDIVTQFDKYNAFMANANAGYLQLKVAMLAELISSLANNAMAKQYILPEWGTLLTTALKGFGTKTFASELTDEENELVRTRQFVPIIDRWFGKSWPGRATA